MTVVCAWCGKVLKKGPPPVSHGICTACAEDFAWNTHSVRVAQDDTLSERGRGLTAPRAAGTSGPDLSPMPRSENVYPLFHEQIDEEAS